MLKEFKLEDIDPVGDLKNKVLMLLNFFGRVVDGENYDLILFLLLLQKKEVLARLDISNKSDLKARLHNLLKKLENDSDIYIKLFDHYQNFVSNEDLYQIIKGLENLNQLILKKHFTLIFEDLFYKFSKLRGKAFGELLMPMELSRFMCALTTLPDKGKIYNPFAGMASFGVFLEEGHYFGQEIGWATWALGTIRLLANGRDITNYTANDSILNWPSNDEKFDLIISNPPFGLRLDQTYKNLYPTISTVEQFLFEKSLSSLNDKGKLITVVPNGFLFRGGSEKKTREFLINSDLIESIISFPGGLYSNTLIPVVVLVINKSKKKKGIVNFIDAGNFVESSNIKEKKLNDYRLNSLVRSTKETDSLRFISNETVIINDYNLNVTRYFVNKYEGVKLGDLVSSIRGQRINDFLKEKVTLIRVRDLKMNATDFYLDIKNIEDVELPKNRYVTRIDESCLLFSTHDKHIKPTYFEYNDTPIYFTNDILAFKVDNSLIDLEYLVSELNSDYVLEQIKSIINVSVISIIYQEDLLNIKINVPSFEEQKAKVKGVKQAFIENKKKELVLQQELLGLKEETFREFASIKHTFRQYLNALKSNVAGTRLFILNNHESGINLDTIYSKNLNKSFGEHLLGLEGTINSMSKLLTSFESSTKNTIVKEHDLMQLVEEAQNRFKNSELFQFEKVYFDKDSFAFEDEDGQYRSSIISIDEDDFYRIFSNIVSNAIDHGFKDSLKKYSIRTAIIYDEKEQMCILEVSNDGKAMPIGFALKDLTTSGGKTSDSKGTGMGGADIKNILKKYNGTLDIINDQTQEFSVTYIIKLPLFTVTL